MATRKSDSKRSKISDIEEKRKEQLEEVRSIVSQLEQQHEEKARTYRKQLDLLESVSLGLYEEIDKLSKKAPADAVTDLLLEQMNEVIKETKELILDDRYIQKLNEFVPAGDNPPHRDAIVVMKQVRQGLDRFKRKLTPLIKQLEEYLETAKGMEVALQLYVDGHTSVENDELKAYNTSVPSAWLKRQGAGLELCFDFNKLDKFKIATLFELDDE